MRTLMVLVLVACTTRAAPQQTLISNYNPDAPPTEHPPEASAHDRDGDGVGATAGSEDMCPELREDIDGIWDHDGCPDPDNDRDGMPDLLDQCPNDEETSNGIDDGDGCPD